MMINHKKHSENKSSLHFRKRKHNWYLPTPKKQTKQKQMINKTAKSLIPFLKKVYSNFRPFLLIVKNMYLKIFMIANSCMYFGETLFHYTDPFS